MKSFPAGFLFIMYITDFLLGKVPVKGPFFKLCINSDFVFVHFLLLSKLSSPDRIYRQCMEFCGMDIKYIKQS